MITVETFPGALKRSFPRMNAGAPTKNFTPWGVARRVSAAHSGTALNFVAFVQSPHLLLRRQKKYPPTPGVGHSRNLRFLHLTDVYAQHQPNSRSADVGAHSSRSLFAGEISGGARDLPADLCSPQR